MVASYANKAKSQMYRTKERIYPLIVNRIRKEKRSSQPTSNCSNFKAIISERRNRNKVIT